MELKKENLQNNNRRQKNPAAQPVEFGYTIHPGLKVYLCVCAFSLFTFCPSSCLGAKTAAPDQLDPTYLLLGEQIKANKELSINDVLLRPVKHQTQTPDDTKTQKTPAAIDTSTETDPGLEETAPDSDQPNVQTESPEPQITVAEPNTEPVNSPALAVATAEPSIIITRNLSTSDDAINAIESSLPQQPQIPNAISELQYPVAEVETKIWQIPASNQEYESNRLQQQLQQARISFADEPQDKKQRSQLGQMVEQIRSVKFKPQKSGPEPIIVVENKPKPPTNHRLQNKKPLPPPSMENSEPKSNTTPDDDSQNNTQLPYETLTPETLEIITKASSKPGRMQNPLELADVLFNSQYLKEAALFYQQALDNYSPDAPENADNRAWVLFQIGNCLKHDDPITASKRYRQLIAEYPSSPWTDLAKAQDKLTQWYQQDRPKEFITASTLQDEP